MRDFDFIKLNTNMFQDKEVEGRTNIEISYEFDDDVPPEVKAKLADAHGLKLLSDLVMKIASMKPMDADTKLKVLSSIGVASEAVRVAVKSTLNNLALIKMVDQLDPTFFDEDNGAKDIETTLMRLDLDCARAHTLLELGTRELIDDTEGKLSDMEVAHEVQRLAGVYKIKLDN